MQGAGVSDEGHMADLPDFIVNALEGAGDDGSGELGDASRSCLVPFCEICVDKIDNPVATPCGHTFCRKCLFAAFVEQIAKRNHRYCPVCSHKLQAVADRLQPNGILSYLLPALGMARRGDVDMHKIVHDIVGFQTTPVDVTRLRNYIGTCISRLEAMERQVAANQARKFEMDKYDEGWWIPRVAQHEADFERVRGCKEIGAPHLLYHAIMAPSIPFATMNSDDLERLRVLPVHAIAAEGAVVFIGGRPVDTSAIIQIMEAWGFVYHSIFAIVNFTNPRDTVRQTKPYNHHKSFIFHMGLVAPGTSKSAITSPQRRILVHTAPEHKFLDTEFYDQMNKDLLSLPRRAELFCERQREGWDMVLPDFFRGLVV